MPFLVAVPFVVVVSGLVVIGLAAMSQSQSSAFTSWLSSHLGVIGVTLALGLEASLSLSRWITKKLGEHFSGITRLTVGWVAGLYSYVERTGALALTWPTELFKVTYWLLWHEIPRMVKALPTAAARVIHQTVTRVVKVERTIVKLPKLTKAQAKALIGAAVATYIAPYLSMLRWLKSHYHALTAVIPHVAPIPIGRTIAGIRARLRRLEKAGVGTIAVAALAATLARMGLSWLRCPGVKKAGKRVCGMDIGLLESLLFDTLLIAGTVSLVDLAKALQEVEGVVTDSVTAFIREV